MLTAYRGKGMWQRQLVNNHNQTFLWQEVKEFGKDNQWTTIPVRLVIGKYNDPQLTGLPATFRSAMCRPHERGFFFFFFWHESVLCPHETSHSTHSPRPYVFYPLSSFFFFFFFWCDRLAICEILPVFLCTGPKFQTTSPTRHFA